MIFLYVGSDQIWSTAEEKIDSFYYLQFSNNKKKISYAPSIGKKLIGEKVKSQFIKYVKEFDFLSVREKTAANIINDSLNIMPKVVADPTLLFTDVEWCELLNLKENYDKDEYIFAYFLTKNKNYYKVVRKFAKKNGLRIISNIELRESCGEETVMDTSDFVNYLKNAKYVFTDSYHGLIFSIIFNKQFLLFLRHQDDDKMSENSRIYDLLYICNLKHRIFDSTKSIDFQLSNKIEYLLVQNNLENFIEKSKKYLEDALKY